MEEDTETKRFKERIDARSSGEIVKNGRNMREWPGYRVKGAASVRGGWNRAGTMKKREGVGVARWGWRELGGTGRG